MPYAISVEGVKKSYGDVSAVDGVSLDIEEGEFFGILGPNGAGKTTLLEIVEGLRKADEGKASVLGASLWPRNPDVLPRVGVLLQATSFFERLTAREQIQTFGALYGVPPGKAEAMLDVVGLADKAATPVEQLSGGQAQRLSIACTLVHDPDVVFLDEPSAGLDPQARRNVWDVLREINTEGRTIVLTTHYMEEAEVLCDRVAIMDHGQILRMGPPAGLIRGMESPVRIIIASGVLETSDVRKLTGADEVTDDGDSLTISTRQPSSVVSALAERDALDGVQIRGATLEDVFLTLTGREFRP